jgi:SAM-dependent methyltransferase
MDPEVAANREHWNAKSAAYQATHDPAIGAAPKLWGAHAISESSLQAIGDVAGLAVLEFGCGAAQWAGSLAAEGAQVIGLDLSDAQLAVARSKYPTLSLTQAAGQSLPFAANSFDLVFCDHGAMGWVDPYLAVPEVARVLRRGGRLVFNVVSPFLEVCWDDAIGGPAARLRSDYFGIHGSTEPDGATHFALGYGEWVRLLRANRLVIEDLIEPRPADASPNTYWSSDPPDWFTRWPGECLWVTRMATP